MRICFLAEANSIHSIRWVNYFVDKGHDVYWISSTNPDNPDIINDKKNLQFHLIKNLPWKPLAILWDTILVKKLIKKINPDIFHVHYAGVDGVIGALSGFHPFVLTAWGSEILIATKSSIVKTLVKFALNKADLITCDAEHMRKAIIKLGTLESKIKIINFGVETDKFAPGPKDKEIINKLRIQDSLVVISLRNLEPLYDIQTLIKAAPLILKEIKNVKFIIGGRGSEEEKLKEMAENLNIFDNILFIGFIPNKELPPYLRLSDVYVSTSLSDAGIAASTAEAMSCALPVVITNSGENEKWIKDGEDGFLVPVRKPEILAQKLIYLLKNERLRLDFGKINRRIIQERNDYSREMAKMENIYKELV